MMYRTDKQFMKNPATSASRVYVGSLNKTVLADDLEAKFKGHGKILGLSLQQGFAFIQYENDYEAQSAIRQEHGTMMHGRKIIVKQALDKKPNFQSPQTGQNQSPQFQRPQQPQGPPSTPQKPPPEPENRPLNFQKPDEVMDEEPMQDEEMEQEHLPMRPPPLMGKDDNRGGDRDRMDRGRPGDRGRMDDRNDRGPGDRGDRGPGDRVDRGPGDRSDRGPGDRSDRGPGDRNDRGQDRSFDRGDRGMDRGNRGPDRGDRGPDRGELGDRNLDRGDRTFDRSDRGGDRNFDRSLDRGDRGGLRGDRASDRGGRGRSADRGGRGRGRGGGRGDSNDRDRFEPPSRDSFREGPGFFEKDQGRFGGPPPSNFQPPTPLVEPPTPDRNDCEIIVVSKALTEYAEFVEQRLKQLGLIVDLLFPNEDVPIGKVLANISSRGCLYAILVMPQNEEHRSLTLNVLHGIPQEHRNMPLEDALILISRNFEAYMRGEKDTVENPGQMRLDDKHPLPMQTIMNLLAENRQLTTSQYDKLINYLQDRRELQREHEVAEGVESESQGSNKQAELQNRIMNILNKSSAEAAIPASITSMNISEPVQPPPPTSGPTPLLKDPSVQKALDSLLLGDMFKNMSGA